MKNKPSDGVVTFAIQVSGKEIPATMSVSAIDLHFNVSGIAQSRIVILTDFVDGELDKSIYTTWPLGVSVNIKVGYDSLNTLLFSGKVERINLDIQQGLGPLFEIICVNYDEEIVKSNQVTEFTYGEDILALRLSEEEEGQSGLIQTTGDASLLPGGKVQIKGLGGPFSGRFEIETVNHNLKEGNWITELDLSKSQ
ncbi:hypothetical protein [Roseivirga sp.]|uniref:hypothetical protein n=1 Tax=Roseivirga sp. TaxID=1964215 RepID=UPI003B52AB61